MRTREKVVCYSDRTYFFGSIAMVLTWINGGLRSLEIMTRIRIPQYLSMGILIILFFSLSLGFVNGYRSWKEPNTFKKIIGVLFILITASYLLYLVIQRFVLE